MLSPQVKTQVDVVYESFRPSLAAADQASDRLLSGSVFQTALKTLSSTYRNALDSASGALRNARQLAASAMGVLEEMRSLGTIEGREANDEDAKRVMTILVKASEGYGAAAANVESVQPLRLFAAAAFDAFVQAATYVAGLGADLAESMKWLFKGVAVGVKAVGLLAPVLVVGAVGVLLLAYGGGTGARAARSARAIRRELSGVRRRRAR